MCCWQHLFSDLLSLAVCCVHFSARDAFVRTNRRTIANLPWCSSVCLSARLSVSLGRACIFKLWLNSPMWWPTRLLPAVFFRVPYGREVGMDVQTMCDISRMVEERLSYYWVLIGSHKCRVDWHANGWPWMTLNGRFVHRALSLR